jgi:hypothetical protein
LEFEINKEYIANNLCENKNKPVLKCGGKCQLSKKLVQEDSSSGNTSSYQVAFQELVFADDIAAFCFTEFHKLKASTFPSYLINSYPTPHFAIFHPPLR